VCHTVHPFFRNFYRIFKIVRCTQGACVGVVYIKGGKDAAPARVRFERVNGRPPFARKHAY